MSFTDLPPVAAFAHQDARVGFEVIYFESAGPGLTMTGCTTAVEDGQAWIVDYTIAVDDQWRTRSAHVRGRSNAGESAVTLESDGAGRWTVDSAPAPHLDGCMDVDLESSALTNALPVHRLALAIGDSVAAPAAYVRAVGLQVERLEQTYARIEDDGTRQRYQYAAEVFDFSCQLVYDAAGLVLAYPGIAVRAA